MGVSLWKKDWKAERTGIVDRMQEKLDSGNYKYLVQRFGGEEISSKYEWLYNLMNDYISARGYQDKILISHDILSHVIVDYFVDVDRLKEFQEIENLHPSKIYAYIGFWLLRHKPMQVLAAEEAEELAFVNEEFVCCLVRSYLFSEPENVPILDNQYETVDNFVSTLLYYFQYREYSAKNIEIMILAFQAGRGYQYSVDHQ